MFRIGIGLHITDLFMGITGYMSSIPPSFPDDPTNPSELLAYWNGDIATDKLSLTDQVGDTSVPVDLDLSGRCYTAQGADTIAVTGLLATDTVEVATGSAVPVLTNDTITLSVGLAYWEITIKRAGIVIGFFPCSEDLDTIAINSVKTGVIDNGVITTTNLTAFKTTLSDGGGHDITQAGVTVSDGVSYYYDILHTQLIPTDVLIPPLSGSTSLCSAFTVTGAQAPLTYPPNIKQNLQIVQTKALDLSLTDVIDFSDLFTIVSFEGTAEVTLTGQQLTVDIAGTFLNMLDSLGRVWRCGETSVTATQIFSEDGLATGTITTADLPTMRSGRIDDVEDRNVTQGFGYRQEYVKYNTEFETSPWIPMGAYTVTDMGEFKRVVQTVADARMLRQNNIPAPSSTEELSWKMEARALEGYADHRGKFVALSASPDPVVSIGEADDTLPTDEFSTLIFRTDGYENVSFWTNTLSSGSVTGLDVKSVSLVKSVGVQLYSNGDSISEGAHEETYITYSNCYPNLFAIANKLEFLNDGVGGDKLAQIHTRLTASLTTLGTVPVILLEGGTNDSGDADPLAGMQSEMIAMIAESKDVSDQVIVFTIPHRLANRAVIDAYNTWLVSYAVSEDVQCFVMDNVLAPEGVPDWSLYNSDQIHPNLAGQRALFTSLNSFISIPSTVSEWNHSSIITTDTPFDGTERLPFIDEVELWERGTYRALPTPSMINTDDGINFYTDPMTHEMLDFDYTDLSELGVEKIENGDFTKWTDPTVPDGWVKVGTPTLADDNGMMTITNVSDYSSGVEQVIPVTNKGAEIEVTLKTKVSAGAGRVIFYQQGGAYSAIHTIEVTNTALLNIVVRFTSDPDYGIRAKFIPYSSDPAQIFTTDLISFREVNQIQNNNKQYYWSICKGNAIYTVQLTDGQDAEVMPWFFCDSLKGCDAGLTIGTLAGTLKPSYFDDAVIDSFTWDASAVTIEMEAGYTPSNPYMTIYVAGLRTVLAWDGVNYSATGSHKTEDQAIVNYLVANSGEVVCVKMNSTPAQTFNLVDGGFNVIDNGYNAIDTGVPL